MSNNYLHVGGKRSLVEHSVSKERKQVTSRIMSSHTSDKQIVQFPLGHNQFLRKMLSCVFHHARKKQVTMFLCFTI